MATKTKITLIIIGILILVLVFIGIAKYFSKGNRKGRAAERKVAGVLKKFAKNDNSRILNNVYLPLYKKTCEIDHLVFGRFGVLVVETKGISGTVSGKGKKLKHTLGEVEHKLYNPALQNQTHMDNVIHHLKIGGFENTPVYGAVVFTDKNIRLDANVGMKLDQFKEYYSNLPDAKCNQDVLLHYFQELRVTNPLRKFLHKFSKKDWD